MSYALVNKLTAKPGHRDEVVDILLESGRLLDDPACALYLVTKAVDDPDLIYVVDLWATKEAHEAALQQPELRPFVERAMPLLEGMPEQTELEPAGGGGPLLG